ncbi:MAG: putative CoA-binding protein [Flavobacteriales bacterium]|jgi:predicted CoA-binding protein
MTNKKTLIIGASTNPDRYSYKAAHALTSKGHDIINYGLKKGEVAGEIIQSDWDTNWKIDTVTLYIGPKNQPEYFDQIIALKPKRVIFNPGTENPIFYSKLNEAAIHYEEACTLVLLSIGQY